MTIAVITDGSNRAPTLFELERLVEVLARRGVLVVRYVDEPGTGQAVGAYVRARDLAETEPWAESSRAILDGDGQPDLFGQCVRPTAQLLITFRGGAPDLVAATLERGLPVEWIPDADEPRLWNLHHGEPPGPAIYIGRSKKHGGPSPLANPNPIELAEGETRAEAAAQNLDDYKVELWARMRDPKSRARETLASITPAHYLVCSCWPRHCHGEVVVLAWRWMHSQRARARQ